LGAGTVLVPTPELHRHQFMHIFAPPPQETFRTRAKPYSAHRRDFWNTLRSAGHEQG